MKKWPPHFYFKTGIKKGIPVARINVLMRKIETIEKNNLPIILTLKHLALLVGVSYKFVYSLIIGRSKLISKNRALGVTNLYRKSPYRSFRIQKRNPKGGAKRYRVICVPVRRLCVIQRWIHSKILSLIKPSRYSYAFTKGNSIKECAEQHIGCSWLIKIDIENFFESITEDQVYYVFRKGGYSPLLSFELASICTKERKKPPYGIWGIRHYSRKPKWNTIKQYQRMYKRFLPQGAPTSPALSNLVMRGFDEEMGRLAESEEMVYTRYADDLYLSSRRKDFNRKRATYIVKQIYDLIRKYKFKPNYLKTKIIPPRARKIVLGLVVESTGVFLQRRFKNNLEVNYYYFVKDALSHVKQKKYKSVFGAYNHINGLFNYAKQIEPNFCNRLIKKNGGKTLQDVLSEIMSI